MGIAPGLREVLKSDGFSAFREIGEIFKPHDASPGAHSNRYFAPVGEVEIGASISLLKSGAADAARSSEIARLYSEACARAANLNITRLVLTPCFRQRRAMFGSDEPYEKAIASMLETLDRISRASPDLEITLVARSTDENALIQASMNALQEKRRSLGLLASPAVNRTL
jgi:hypothetical protein